MCNPTQSRTCMELNWIVISTVCNNNQVEHLSEKCGGYIPKHLGYFSNRRFCMFDLRVVSESGSHFYQCPGQQLPNLGLLWPWFCSYSMTKDLACSTTAMCFFGWIPQFFTVWHLHLHAASYWKSSPRHIPVWIVWPPSAAPSCHLGSTPGMQKSPHKFPATPGMVCSDSYPFLMPVNTNDPSIPFDISNNINH